MYFSIITCTYNPDDEIFNRLIKAVSRLEIPNNVSVEWIIVDNNSTQSVEKSFDFSSIQIPLLHVVEQTPGLTSARIAGFKASKGDWIVFFDDDNEPNEDYIKNAFALINNNNNVGIWGAGRIAVNFEKNARWLEAYRQLFQERNIKNEIIQNSNTWQNNYPQGTGQVIKRMLFEDYKTKVESNQYSLSDRSGKSLSSGGDVQIVLNAIKYGYCVGVSEDLKLYHHIDASKCSFSYVLRLIYGMASGAVLAHHQVFPYKTNYQPISNKNVLTILLNYIRQFKIQAFSKSKISILAQRLGDLNAQWVAFGDTISKPTLLRQLEKRIF